MRYEGDTRREDGEGTWKYPRDQMGSIESHSLACMKGFLGSYFHVFIWHVTHSWQGGVLERIERHLAFLRWRLALQPGSFFY
jgi:hypothetical protein